MSLLRPPPRPAIESYADRDSTYSSDEVDLRELIFVLWRSRYTIVVITVVTVLTAVTYVLLSTPVYQTETKALPPAAAGLDAYNNAFRMSGPAVEGVVSDLSDTAKNRLMSEAIPVLSPDDAYQYFARHLGSAALRRNFFEAHFLPAMDLIEPVTDAQYGQLWRRFTDQLTVSMPGRDSEHITVTWEGENPSTITQWANLYMQMGIKATQHELATNVRSALNILDTSLNDQMASLRAGAKKQREQRIVRLSEALHLAESIGLASPSTAGNLITSYSGETTYMRGSDAIRNEIILLENRLSDDPFILELAGLLMRQNLLSTVKVGSDDIAVARIDQIAHVPSTPIKPRKALIVALGLVLGGMLGIFVVLIRNMFRN